MLLIATLAGLCVLQLVLSLRARPSVLAMTVVFIISMILPRSAIAEPEKKFAVGVVVSEGRVQVWRALSPRIGMRL